MDTSSLPDYGEPWHQQEPPHPISKDKGVYWLNPEQFNRACECVNACAGMADPAAEIQAMRDAIKEAHEGVVFALTYHNLDGESSIERLVKTLAKLNPFLK